MDSNKAWDYALGIIKVDGLEPTQEFLDMVELQKQGKVTDKEMYDYLDQKYRIKES